MAPWLTEFIKLKKFEKIKQQKQDCSDLPSLSPLKQVRRKETPYLQRRKDIKKNLNKQVLVSFPHFTALTLYSFTSPVLSQLPILHQTQ